MRRLIRRAALSEEMIEYLNDKDMSKELMDELKESSVNFAQDQLDLIYKYKKTSYLKDEIISGFENGLSLDQVKIYANPKIKKEKREIIKLGLINNYNSEDILDVLDDNFKTSQFKQIYYGFEQNFPIDIIKAYANPEINGSIMLGCVYEYERNKVSAKQIEKAIKYYLYRDHREDYDIYRIFHAIKQNCYPDDIIEYCAKNFDNLSIINSNQLAESIKNNDLSMDQIKYIIKNFDEKIIHHSAIMDFIVNIFKKGLPMNQIKNLAEKMSKLYDED